MGSARFGIGPNKRARKKPANPSSKTNWPRSANRSGSTKRKRRRAHACHGSRLNPIARHVRLQNQTIDNFTALSAGEALRLIGKLRFRGNQKTVADDLVPEISQRLRFMENVGLGYLALGRSAKTLSGGESQRIRLAAQLGSNLRGVLYVLDEPTIGLASAGQSSLARHADGACARRETRSSSSSTTKRRCAAPITSSIWAPAPGCTAAKSWCRERCAISKDTRVRRPAAV